MTIYVWKDGRWRDKASGEPMRLPAREAVVAPIVQSDIADYRSPIDGRLITSRSQRREDLKRSGCVEAEPRPKHRRGYRNASFAAKRGLLLREDARHGLADMARQTGAARTSRRVTQTASGPGRRRREQAQPDLQARQAEP